MANEININASRTPLQGVALEQAAKLAGDATKAKEIVGKALEILAGANVKVTRSDDTTATGAGEKKTTGATNVPSLDNPGDVKQIQANLEKLVAYLQLDNEERQTQMAKDRIEVQKDNLETEHKGRMKELEKSFKKMEDAEKSRLASKVFGWLGAILAVVTAVVVTVVTGGTAAAFAIAGAAVAVSALVLNETGAMDSITKKLAETLQDKFGLSKSQAQLAASLIINLSIMAAQLGCAIGSAVSVAASAAKAASDAASTAATVSTTATKIQNIVTIANTLVSAGNLVSGGANSFFTYRSDDAKADLSELQKFIAILQQRLDESEEELQIIVEQIQSAIGKIADIISSATDQSAEIANKIGQMA
ncbi:MAG: type III secretion system translocon subunit SctE [Kiritimatiellae bacterium]|nr:type III secretion system translocon subunit SctE [Kiritimatiellia bacterium]